MSPAILALTVALADDPRLWIVKARPRFESAPGIHIVYEYSTTGATKPARVEYDAKLPLHQHMVVSLDSSRFEFTQSPTGAIYIDHVDKTYSDFLPASFTFPMPPETPVENGLPPLFAWELGQLQKPGQWKVTKDGSPATVETEVQLVSGAVLHFTALVQPDGKLLDFKLRTKGEAGESNSEWKLVEEVLEDRGQANIKEELPEGYEPAFLTRAIQTISPGLFMPRSRAANARANGEIDLYIKGKPAVLLFTAPDCPISSHLEGVLLDLKGQIESTGASFTELSLSPTPPDCSAKDPSRPVGYDPDQTIDRSLRLPLTPYFIVLDKSGRMVRGFAGYADDQKSTLTDTILRALKGQPSKD